MCIRDSLISWMLMVLPEGIELSISPLPSESCKVLTKFGKVFVPRVRCHVGVTLNRPHRFFGGNSHFYRILHSAFLAGFPRECIYPTGASCFSSFRVQPWWRHLGVAARSSQLRMNGGQLGEAEHNLNSQQCTPSSRLNRCGAFVCIQTPSLNEEAALRVLQIGLL